MATLVFGAALFGGAALAQGTTIAFGTMERDADAPVEIVSDELSINDASDTAVFSGNVVIAQNDMRLAAPRVEVIYLADRSGIDRLIATGGVTMVSGDEAAEADRADYSVEAGTVLLTGNVLMTQGRSSLVSERATINLDDGTAQMDGRVRTILQTGEN
ncbi:LptA/OstA family protein [Poseidonocella sedimentorum]|uniref:LptA/OstA family protein n=1 Tax=Poseidonocella sedimentorum TaxID=871652 RepID=UPI001FEA329A|nr:LptA/OstA family protein [Poseidonocella sedimentorum]